MNSRSQIHILTGTHTPLHSTQYENQISAKEKQKTLEWFLFQNGGYLIPKTSIRKICGNIGKIQFEKKQTFGYIISNCICGSGNCSGNSSPFFSLQHANFLNIHWAFLYGALLESVYLNLPLMPFLWYVDSVEQFLGSYGGHLLVVDPVTWAISAWKIMTPVSIVCKHCLWKATLSDNLIHVCYPFH